MTTTTVRTRSFHPLTNVARSRSGFGAALVVFLLLMAFPVTAEGKGQNSNAYSVTPLVSNGPTDSNLVNGWGIAASPTGPWWVSDNGTGVSTLYDGTGQIQPLVVSLQDGPDSAPTGITFYGGSEFVVSDGFNSGPSRFLFAGENGKVYGWNPAVPPPPLSSQSFIVHDESDEGNIYKGIAIAATNDGDRLFLTDFFHATVAAYDGDFEDVDLPPGAFQDSRIPADFGPFGIRAINGLVYVTYAKADEDREDDVAGQGLGFIDVFDTDGGLVGRIAAGGQLNAPWGLALAPEGFGRFSGDLLVGNFGDGHILAYRLSADGTKASFDGFLRDGRGQKISIDGLWGIDFGNGAGSGPTTTLYFAAGPNDEADGLFGRIDAN